MNLPQSLLAALVAEHYKQRRTVVRALSLIMPIATLAMSLFSLLAVGPIAAANNEPAWHLYGGALLGIWASFFLPVMVALQGARLTQLEHANQQWKFQLTVPGVRLTLFAAKYLHLLGLIILAEVVLLILGLITIHWAGIDATDSLWRILTHMLPNLARITCAAMLMTAIQLFVSVLTASTVAAMTTGLLGTLIAVMLKPSGVSLVHIVPWLLPVDALGSHGVLWYLAIVGSSLLVCAAGTAMLCYREVR